MIRFPYSGNLMYCLSSIPANLNLTRRKLPEFKFWFGAIRAAALACLVSLGLCGFGRPTKRSRCWAAKACELRVGKC